MVDSPVRYSSANASVDGHAGDEALAEALSELHVLWDQYMALKREESDAGFNWLEDQQSGSDALSEDEVSELIQLARSESPDIELVRESIDEMRQLIAAVEAGPS